MKTRIFKTGILAVAALLMSFTTPGKEKKSIDTSKSTIEWVGKKVGGKHNGTIKLKSGEVVLKSGKLVGGNFVVDMTTINVTDLQGEYKGKLEGHLKSDDFFGVAKYKEATFKITKVQGEKVTGKLTIKGHTENATFTLKNNAGSLTGTILIDRTKFGVKYGSTLFGALKDKAIHDEFELTLNIKY